MLWKTGTTNTFPRWPNSTKWPSAWDVEKVQNATHVVNYTINAGWITNLVSNYWPLGRKNQAGQDLFGGDFWFQGAKRVDYEEITVEPGIFAIPGIPDGRDTPEKAYYDFINNERHYWSTAPTNQTETYNTSFRVWGSFTTYVTHLSNNQATIDCHTGATPCTENLNVTSHSRGRSEHENIMQCPFQFRCFTPESVAGSPGCHRHYPNDYLNEGDNAVHAGKSPTLFVY